MSKINKCTGCYSLVGKVCSLSLTTMYVNDYPPDFNCEYKPRFLRDLKPKFLEKLILGEINFEINNKQICKFLFEFLESNNRMNQITHSFEKQIPKKQLTDKQFNVLVANVKAVIKEKYTKK